MLRGFVRQYRPRQNYGTEEPTGKWLRAEVGERLATLKANRPSAGAATVATAKNARDGQPVVVTLRLVQGAFRAMVTDAYSRRCVMTVERTLPVLEAAHIRPYSEGGQHELRNGLLLRSDLHRLFDAGCLTVEPDSQKSLSACCPAGMSALPTAICRYSILSSSV